MATVSSLTKARMLSIEASSVVSGVVDENGDLILTKYDGTVINAGRVLGTPGEDATALLTIEDTPTVNMELAGAGTPESPWVIKATAAQQVPPGVVQDYAGAVAPAGYLMCDGGLYSQAQYADLFAAIGLTYGYYPASVTRRNYLPNPGFENAGGTNFGYNHGTAAYDTTWKLSGASSVRFTANGANGGDNWFYPGGWDYSLGLKGLTAGKTYTLSATIRQTAVHSGSSVAWYNSIRVLAGTSGSASYTINSTPKPNAIGEQRVSVTFTIPADATYFGIRFCNGFATSVTYWDEGLLEEGVTLGTWFSGDSASDGTVGWEGGVNASSSIQGPGGFRVPNKKGRVSVALDSSQTEFNTLGKIGGAKTHTLSVAEIPSHTHAQNVSANSGGTAVRNDYDSDTNGGIYPQGINTNATGGGGAHNNLQPYMALNSIIKT